MNKDEALKVILSDIKQAKDAKGEIDEKIEQWLKEYEGEPYGGEQKGRSKIVVKDIKKAVEWFIPNAVGPFVDKNKIVKLEGITGDDVEPAKIHERLLNYQFNRKFDKYNFAHSMMGVGSKEGSTVLMAGWAYEEEETIERHENVPYEFIQQLEQEGVEYKIIQNEDEDEDWEGEIKPGETFNIKVKRIKVLKNHPTAEVVRNGNVFPDPSTDNQDDLSFVAYRYEATLSDLIKSGKYSKEDIEELKLVLKESDEGLESTRNAHLSGYGRSTSYSSEAEANKKLTVYEYWGHLDMDNDGISEPVMATVVNDKLLEIIDNPMPDKKIPFIFIQFSKIPFSIWGAPIAEFISDNQKVRTSIMRGFIDNLAQSNNGKKFVKKGTFDAVNKRKYEQNLGGLIEFNQNPEFIDGGFNQIPNSIFNLYELVQQEAESLSGINRTAQGLDSGALNDSATGASIQNDMSQKRMKDIVRRYAEGIKKLLRHWIAYNKEFLSDEEVMRISGKHIEFRRDDIAGEFDLDITVGVSGLEEVKVNQMSMLIQNIHNFGATVDPSFTNLILANMAEIWGLPDVAMKLEEAVQNPKGPSEAELKAQQMEMERMQAEIDELRSKAELNKSKSFDNMSSANGKNVDNKMKAAGIVNPKGI